MIDNNEVIEQTQEEVQVEEAAPVQTQEPVISSSEDLNKYRESKKSEQAKVVEKKVEKKEEKPAFNPQYGPPEKQYKEIQNLVQKQGKELSELRKWRQENQTTVEAYKKFLEEQQEREIIEKYKDDPANLIKELSNRKASSVAEAQMQQIQPLIAKAQANDINEQLKQMTGDDYGVLAPVMADMIEHLEGLDEQNGTNHAQQLASNPVMLKALARDYVVESQRQSSTQATQAAQVKRAQNLKNASGVARTSTSSQATTDDISTLSLDDARKVLKQRGILQ